MLPLRGGTDVSARCGSCHAEIVWAKTTTGASMPLDADPTPEGNVAAHRNDQGELIARVLKAGDEVAPWEHRGTSHFQTCADADKHRKKKR